jgi:putative flippase GtrA
MTASAGARQRGTTTAPVAATTAHVARLPGGLGREVLSFAAIGIVSTAAYAVLYLLLRTIVGATAANAGALVITAIGNTAANRRLTFGVHDRSSMLRDQAGGLAALGVALAITTVSVKVLGAVLPDAGRLVELSVLVVANAIATVARFVLLRAWISGDRDRAVQPASHPARSQS